MPQSKIRIITFQDERDLLTQVQKEAGECAVAWSDPKRTTYSMFEARAKYLETEKVLIEALRYRSGIER